MTESTMLSLFPIFLFYPLSHPPCAISAWEHGRLGFFVRRHPFCCCCCLDFALFWWCEQILCFIRFCYHPVFFIIFERESKIVTNMILENIFMTLGKENMLYLLKKKRKKNKNKDKMKRVPFKFCVSILLNLVSVPQWVKLISF